MAYRDLSRITKYDDSWGYHKDDQDAVQKLRELVKYRTLEEIKEALDEYDSVHGKARDRYDLRHSI